MQRRTRRLCVRWSEFESTKLGVGRVLGASPRFQSGPDSAHCVGAAEIRTCLDELAALLKQDATRANTVFRQILEPITMTPVEEGNGRRFYRATRAAKAPEMLDRLGLAQAVDFGGCGGWI